MQMVKSLKTWKFFQKEESNFKKSSKNCHQQMAVFFVINFIINAFEIISF